MLKIVWAVLTWEDNSFIHVHLIGIYRCLILSTQYWSDNVALCVAPHKWRLSRCFVYALAPPSDKGSIRRSSGSKCIHVVADSIRKNNSYFYFLKSLLKYD